METVKIIRIPILPMHMVNSHLLVGPDGCILVDAGLPGSEKKIEKALTKERLTLKDIKLIVITHAHVDHAGSAAIIRERSGAPILAHEGCYYGLFNFTILNCFESKPSFRLASDYPKESRAQL